MIDENILENLEEVQKKQLSYDSLFETTKTIAEEYKDKYLRALADCDNAKKRHASEIDRIKRTAAKDTILALLPVFDDLNRIEGEYEVVDLINKKLNDTLKKLGVETYGEIGDDFDYDLHDAISTTTEGDMAYDEIADVFLKGYKLNKEIIRHAQVVVKKQKDYDEEEK